PGPHHQGVDEEADERLELRTLTMGDRGTDRQGLLAGVAGGRPLQGGEHGHEQGDAATPPERFDGGAGGRRQDETGGDAPGAPGRRPRTGGGGGPGGGGA